MGEHNMSFRIESPGKNGTQRVVALINDDEVFQRSIELSSVSDREQYAKALHRVRAGASVEAIEAELLVQARLAESLKPQPFPVDLLPPLMRNYITEGAAARCVDPAIVALPLLVTVAACIGTTRRIMLKPDWVEPPTLWGAVVARSGSVKSPGFDLSSDLLADAESLANRDHCDAMNEYRKAKLEYERDLSRWKKEQKKAEPPAEPPLPTANRLRVEDTTMEALGPILTENPRGLLLMTDELRGWFEGMGAYSSKGSGRDEARWLSLHHARPFSIDRKTGRERRFIELGTASVTGTIQPRVLSETMFNSSGIASGMLARLLIVMPEPTAKRWTDDTMSRETMAAMQTVLDRLRSDLVHHMEDDRPRPVDIAITSDARNRVASFVNLHGTETFDQPDSLAAAWSKLEAYAFRFGLVMHLVRWASGDRDVDDQGPIGLDSIEAGIELARWFGTEAERAYAAMGFEQKDAESINSDNRHVDRLAEWLETKDGSATEREIGRGPRRYRGNPESLKADCESLVNSGRAKWDSGRKTRRLVLLGNGTTGDGDSSSEDSAMQAEVSPTPTRGDSVDTTPDADRGDTFDENTAKSTEVSASPPPPRERFRI